MQFIKIKNNQITEDIVGTLIDFPKYSKQLINLANQNSQGTRPKVVGQMTELIQEFPGKSYGEWVSWYQENKPKAIEDATNKVFDMLDNLKETIHKIDKDLVREWVKDLVITKTYTGLNFQESILKEIARITNSKYRLATPKEESKGIDGYVGTVAISIKPYTYRSKKPTIREKIDVGIVYYEKRRDGIIIDIKNIMEKMVFV